MVQGLKLSTPGARGLGSIPGQGGRSHMLPFRVDRRQLQIPLAETDLVQSNKNISKYLKKVNPQDFSK